MSLSRRLSPITSRLAHILTAKQTARALNTRSAIDSAVLAVYFGGPLGDIYQVTQWLPIFEQLSSKFPVVLLVKDARAARALAARSVIPIRLAGNANDIEPMSLQMGIRVLFYVNNNLANFSPLRLANVTHVHLSHGESEKASMVSNQLKAYDYCFIAGKASADRIIGALSRFNPDHLKLIGRPQLDQLFACEPLPGVAGRTTILYAPTWEGDRAAMAYSSVTSAAEGWVEAILQGSTLRLVYRPHPKTGTRSKATRVADLAIRKSITEAQRKNPTAGHLVDTGGDYRAALAGADLGIFDISAMAMDFSVLNRPIFVSVPKSLEASLAQNPIWSVARRIPAAQGSELVHHLLGALEDGPLPGAPLFINSHFGDTTPGNASSKFAIAIQDMI